MPSLLKTCDSHTCDRRPDMTEPKIVLPGDDLTDYITSKAVNINNNNPKIKGKPSTNPKIVVGPGLKREDNNRIVVVKCGQLINRETSFWVDAHFKRYVASRADKVIGFVTNKTSMSCRVDIGTNETATLDLLAFPNATKKNKGQVEVGDAIFAQIITDCKDVEPELVCVTSDNKKGGFGVLSNKGFVISVPLHICRRLLSPDSKVIPTLGKKYRFESTVGMNGRIWVNAKSTETTIKIANFFESLEHIPRGQYQEVCEDFLRNSYETVDRK